ncbi:FabA-like domain protein [Cytobacillus firmus]|uniref:FabA-like domain protein n=1 Tax=Cytobacillus firmus TaxID=1399 RepID=UPI0030010084
MDKILDLLPHQSPFRFVDKITEYVPRNSLAAKFSPSNIPFFNLRQVPLSVLVESVAQSAILLTQLETSPLSDDEIPLLGSIDIQLHSESLDDNEVFLIKVNIVKLLSKQAVLSGEVLNGNHQKILSANISVAVAAGMRGD